MRFLFAVVIICFPMLAIAEGVTVRSGEHADFSRLAFEFSGPADWEMGRVENGYEIRLKGAGAAIDTSDVYRRISRDRIKSLVVSEDNTRITLVLGCECHADAFEFRPGLLVVDVKDGQPSAKSIFETRFDSGELSVDPYTGTIILENSPSDVVENAQSLPTAILPFGAPLARSITNPRGGVHVENADATSQLPTKRVAEMQSTILRQIGRAASQGLLDANLPHPPEVGQGREEPANSVVIEAPAPSTKPHINIHIESSIDREFANLATSGLMTDNGSECLSDAQFNVVNWGNADSVLARVSEKRGKISGEFDQIDERAVEDLVKAYIYAGFGAEALDVLAIFNVAIEDENILKAMARIVDGMTSERNPYFDGQISCDTDVALWAALAAPSFSKQDNINRVPILGAFSSLPVHLRKLLGPRLAQKFLEFNDLGTARSIRNAIARAPGDAGPDFRLLDARLDLQRGLTNSAERALEEIIVEDSAIAPNAVIELLEARLEGGDDIDHTLLATAESHIFEQRNTRIGADLTRLIAMSFGQTRDYQKALEVLQKLDSFAQLEKQEKEKAWEDVLESVTDDATEVALLQFVFAAQSEIDHQTLSRKTRRKLALRLLKEGWPVMAEKVLAAPTSPATDDRMILAQASILNGRAERAISMLENVAGDEAAKLRALAYEKTGKFMDAAREYGAGRDNESQKYATWRSEDWTQLALTGSKVEQAVAQMMLAQNETVDEVEPSINEVIARDNSLLKVSETERDTIERLLEEYPALAQEDS
ncbi:MAG: hypothetical protein L3J30_01730 [Marinosulfonomonas sp.]|nr:hypothetical protein [Marinosulfonomonas sp.]